MTNSLRYAPSIAFTLAILLSQYFLWPHITDDAYILFRYVDRFVDGHGLTFNPFEHVEGYSSPLWVLLLSGVRYLGLANTPDSARTLGLLATSVFGFVGNAILSRSGSVRTSILYIAVLVGTPGIHVFSSAGLEGPLLSALLLFCIYYAGTDRLIPASIFIGLAAITRPEGILYALCFVLWALRTPREGQKRILISLLAVLPFLVWEIFRVLYYQAWLPNTALAKLPGDRLTLGLPYLTPFFFSLGGPLVLLLFSKSTRVKQDLNFEVFQLALCLALSGIVFVAYAQSDWMLFGRYLLPVWPVICLLYVDRLSETIESMKLSNPVSRYLLPIFLIACQLLAWQKPLIEYVNNEGMSMLMRGTDQITVGQYLRANVIAGSSVATGRLGGVSYAAPELIFWDFNGLTDREAAEYRAGKLKTGPNPILNRKPDFILEPAVPAEWSYEKDSAWFAWLKERYLLDRKFPQGKFGTFDLWKRR